MISIIIGCFLVLLAGVAEHYKDLSDEGKLSGYWDKDHKPMIPYSHGVWEEANYDIQRACWWKVHWLQGGVSNLFPNYDWKYAPFIGDWDWLLFDIWDDVPVWIRNYLPFRDGWHLLKFFSLNLFAIGVVLIFNTEWWWYFVLRALFSTPETILRLFR